MCISLANKGEIWREHTGNGQSALPIAMCSLTAVLEQPAASIVTNVTSSELGMLCKVLKYRALPMAICTLRCRGAGFLVSDETFCVYSFLRQEIMRITPIV